MKLSSFSDFKNLIANFKEKNVDKIVRVEKFGTFYEQVINLAEIDLKKMDDYFIYGSVGVGKTYQCEELRKVFPNKVKMISWIDMVKHELAAQNESELRTMIPNLQKQDVLIIDDFSTTKMSSYNLGLLFQIIDFRQQKQLPTIITSNIDPKTLKEDSKNEDKVQSERIMSRLKMFKFVEARGQDLRKYKERT